MKCSNCKKKTGKIAYVNKKQVCEMCFTKLKHQSKTRRPNISAFYERWIKLSKRNRREVKRT